MPEEMRRFVFGLIGYPLGHSKSPLLHDTAFRETGLDGEYRLFPVPPLPEGMASLVSLLEKMRSGEIHGLNVTIPHKQTVIPHLNRLSDAAASIGAVNTIAFKDGMLTGDNTDAEGFRSDYQRRFALSPSRALVLGAGGSARAVVHVLKKDGWRICIAARRKAQAAQLHPEKIIGLPLDPDSVKHFDPGLIVNTTPLGMSPHVDTSPWPENHAFPPGACIYDLVYNPKSTRFLTQARANGLRTAGGLGMLIEQAALAFEIWTGRRPPLDMLEAALG